MTEIPEDLRARIDARYDSVEQSTPRITRHLDALIAAATTKGVLDAAHLYQQAKVAAEEGEGARMMRLVDEANRIVNESVKRR